MAKEYPVLVGGRWAKTAEPLAVKSPYDGAAVAHTFVAGDAEAEEATQAAVRAFEETKKLTPADRAGILQNISFSLAARAEEFATTIALEAGKPVNDARREVQRSIFTFQHAGEEAKRMNGEIIPLDVHPLGAGHTCFVRRFPVGPVLGITPFNFPLNLVAHKVAPALAVGNPIVVKPARQTPITALLLAEVVMQSGWPIGGFSVIPASNGLAERMAGDDRFHFLSFTGSPAVGWRLKAKAGKKKVALELGGNAGAIVHADADIAYAAERIVAGGFGYAGQSCISVQRVFVQESVYEQFKEIFLGKVKALNTGNPLDEKTNVGPLISERDALRIDEWLKEARDGGAKILCGGGRRGTLMEPTVLGNAAPEMKVNCQEIFGPVVTLQPYTHIDEALSAVNGSDFGLQAGIFTNDLRIAFTAWETLDVGGVIVGNVPTYRVDHMPYGGVKSSGMGREGLRWAMEEMTEPKSMVINHR
ncbi:MAG: aldehyde dehydrogenase family protein [Nitrospinae bacterium]|nr:aldehyde dehydrogenase family protein [Nitrospinota bacterium]